MALEHLLNQIDFSLLKADGYRKTVGTSRCIIVAHIHVVDSTVAMFNRLGELGFNFDRIIVAPKPYSTISSAEKSLTNMGVRIIDRPLPSSFTADWYDGYQDRLLRETCVVAREIATRAHSIERIVLVDDGGLLTGEWWHSRYSRLRPCVSVQQTASGLYQKRLRSKVHKIDVGRCIAKKFFESKIIADGVVQRAKLESAVKRAGAIGIIGMGAIGSRLAAALEEEFGKEKEIWVYDVDRKRTHGYPNESDNWRECFQAGEVIFGCTGKDFAYLDPIPRGLPKTMISLSSRDVEFKSFIGSCSLRRTKRVRELFGEIVLEAMMAGPYTILNGGFPINFDRKKEWESPAEIALTRALVLLGILQALCVPVTRKDETIEDVAQHAQRHLVSEWLQIQNVTCQTFGVDEHDFQDLSWWDRDKNLGHQYRRDRRHVQAWNIPV